MSFYLLVSSNFSRFCAFIMFYSASPYLTNRPLRRIICQTATKDLNTPCTCASILFLSSPKLNLTSPSTAISSGLSMTSISTQSPSVFNWVERFLDVGKKILSLLCLRLFQTLLSAVDRAIVRMSISRKARSMRNDCKLFSRWGNGSRKYSGRNIRGSRPNMRDRNGAKTVEAQYESLRFP